MKAKHLFTSLCVIFLLVSELKAQDTMLVNPAKIDSLKHLIEARPKADDEKVRLMNEYARLCFYNQEFMDGLIATRDARELSKKLNFKDGEIMYKLTLAAFAGSETLYGYQIRQAEITAQNDKLFSEYFSQLSIPSGYPPIQNQNLLDKLLPVLQHFEKLEDKDIQLNILFQIAYYYYHTNKLNELEIILKKGILLSRELNQLYPEHFIYSSLIVVFKMVGKNEEAQKTEKELIALFSKDNDKYTQGLLNLAQAHNYNYSSQPAIAADYYLKSIEAFESSGDLHVLGEFCHQLGSIYNSFEMYDKAIEIFEKRISLHKKLKDNNQLSSSYSLAVSSLVHLKRYDDASKYLDLALQLAPPQGKLKRQASINRFKADRFMDEEKYSKAIEYYKKANEAYLKLEKTDATYSIPGLLRDMAVCYKKMGDLPNALKFALECYKKDYEIFEKRARQRSSINFLLSDIYIAMGQPLKAIEYIKEYQKLIEESNKTENANKMAAAEIRSVIEKSDKQINQLEIEKIQKIQESKTQRIWIFSITGALLSALLVAFILFRNNKNKQKANAILEHTLSNLKSTQAQLIQSEKMASLGELTAGIAHEIQNPLNFVNNFSELSVELIDEMNEELANGNLEDVEEISQDLKQNLSKISHHGKRASGIVKGMLEHSRKSDGDKILTDLNVLADEYLRLAYHGLRAKDKSFNADFKTDFEDNIPKIEVVPQDIGRVLLNLINNAFYAVDKKLKEGIDGYKPVVVVSSKKLKDWIEITIKDNGNGIPDEIKDKIFQPFFTTKPTGSGTGLGLSLSYDIVISHGGTIEVNSTTGEGLSDAQSGSTFIIKIPNTNLKA